MNYLQNNYLQQDDIKQIIIEDKKNYYFKRTLNIVISASLLMLTLQGIIATVLMLLMMMGKLTQIDFYGEAYLEDMLYNLIMGDIMKTTYGVSVFAMLIGNIAPSIWVALTNRINLKSLFKKPKITALNLGIMCVVAMGVSVAGSLIYMLINGIVSKIGIGIEYNDIMTPTNDVQTLILMFIVVVILAPITEELLFRGVILKSLTKYSIVLAVIASSFLFALVHGNLAQGIVAFMMGIVMSYITIKSGSIIPAIIMHAFNNGMAYADTVLSYFSGGTSDMIRNMLLVFQILCVVATIVIIIVNFKKIKFTSDDKEEAQKENIIKISKPLKKFFLNPWTFILILSILPLFLATLSM